MPAALRLQELEELVVRLPGTVRRGLAPSDRAGETALLPTGIAALDRALGGGLPRGRLSEIRGCGSAGATSLAQRLTARVTASGDLAAWVDGADAFDPESAAAAGIELGRLLWVRPPDLLAAFSAAELLLSLGGFTLVVLDVGDGPPPLSPSSGRGRIGGGSQALPAARRPSEQRRMEGEALRPSSGRGRIVWIRLARAATRARSALVVLGGAGESGTGSSAALRLELAPAEVVWDRAAGAPALLDGLVARIAVKRNRGFSGERELRIPLR